jgi:hypothetical protein
MSILASSRALTCSAIAPRTRGGHGALVAALVLVLAVCCGWCSTPVEAGLNALGEVTQLPLVPVGAAAAPTAQSGGALTTPDGLFWFFYDATNSKICRGSALSTSIVCVAPGGGFTGAGAIALSAYFSVLYGVRSGDSKLYSIPFNAGTGDLDRDVDGDQPRSG